jgi:prevent-host-death family protein
MAILTSSEARRHFGELLRRVAGGEEIVITRGDRPVARIVPEGRDLEHICMVVASMRRTRQAMSKRKGFRPITDKEIMDAINEGRK